MVNERLKVVSINEEGRYGGPAARITQVAAALKEDDVETTVIFPVRDSGVFENELRSHGISSVPINLHRLTKEPGHLAGYLLSFVPEVLALKKELEKNSHDVIHCHGHKQLKGMLAARLAKKNEQRVVYHLNDSRAPVPLLKKLFCLMARNWVDGFICASRRTRDYYLNGDLPQKPDTVIYPPVDTARFNPETVSPDADIAGMPGIKIVTVCNINSTKGVDVFVDLCDRLTSLHEDQTITFLLVGPVYKSQQRYFNNVMEKAKQKKIDNLHYLGASNSIPEILKPCDIFVCTSRSESGPMTVFEAMSMAMPIVSTDVGDIADIMAQAEGGFCVPVDDLDALTEKLSFLIQHATIRETYGERSRSFAVDNLDLSICKAKHADFYRLIAENVGTGHAITKMTPEELL